MLWGSSGLDVAPPMKQVGVPEATRPFANDWVCHKVVERHAPDVSPLCPQIQAKPAGAAFQVRASRGQLLDAAVDETARSTLRLRQGNRAYRKGNGQGADQAAGYDVPPSNRQFKASAQPRCDAPGGQTRDRGDRHSHTGVMKRRDPCRRVPRVALEHSEQPVQRNQSRPDRHGKPAERAKSVGVNCDQHRHPKNGCEHRATALGEDRQLEHQ